MATRIICIILCLPLLAKSQAVPEWIRQLDDPRVIHIDSSILFVTDTNNLNHRTGDDANQINGVWRSQNPNRPGQLYSVTTYYNGHLHGQAINFYDNGSIANSVYYNMDQLHGRIVRFYTNGKPYEVKDYSNGSLEGWIRKYDTLGRLRKASFAAANDLNGPAVEFYPNGRVKLITHFTDGQENGLRKVYRDSAGMVLLFEADYVDGVCQQRRIYEKVRVLRTEYGRELPENLIKHADSVFLVRHQQINTGDMWPTRTPGEVMDVMDLIAEYRLDASMIRQKVHLTGADLDSLKRILARPVTGPLIPPASCHWPEHAIVIKRGDIYAVLEFGFACHTVSTSENMHYMDEDMDASKWADLQKFFSDHGIKTDNVYIR
jgi:antitoxin component YwqK of YwqJK toxin-antitoxin module